MKKFLTIIFLMVATMAGCAPFVYEGMEVQTKDAFLLCHFHWDAETAQETIVHKDFQGLVNLGERGLCIPGTASQTAYVVYYDAYDPFIKIRLRGDSREWWVHHSDLKF